MSDVAVRINLGHILLPMHTRLEKRLVPNAAKNYSVGGKLYVDTRGYRRVWTIGWDLITIANYDLIRTEWQRQFTEGALQAFAITDPTGSNSVSTVLAYFEMPNPAQIQYAGRYVKGLTITVEEQNAIS